MDRINITEYRKLTKVRDNPEHREAVKLCIYLDEQKDNKQILMFTHIPNGTYTPSWKQKHNNKIEGVRAGFPDYVVATKSELVFIELKREKGGVVSPFQKEWLAVLNLLGFKAVVCKGAEQAIEFLESLKDKNNEQR